MENSFLLLLTRLVRLRCTSGTARFSGASSLPPRAPLFSTELVAVPIGVAGLPVTPKVSSFGCSSSRPLLAPEGDGLVGAAGTSTGSSTGSSFTDSSVAGSSTGSGFTGSPVAASKDGTSSVASSSVPGFSKDAGRGCSQATSPSDGRYGCRWDVSAPPSLLGVWKTLSSSGVGAKIAVNC